VGVLSAADTFTSEEYAVYSAALANIRFTHADRGQGFVIVRDTVDLHELPVPTADCSGLPVALRHRMEDVLVVNHGLPVSSSRTLGEKKLVIGRPYMLVNSRQADEWKRQRFSPRIPTDPPGAEIADQFAGTSDLVRLSNVLFNANKTVALVYVSATCGSLCLSSQWYLVEKTQGVWRVLSTPDCGTIS
jgi:hypothetical protein